MLVVIFAVLPAKTQMSSLMWNTPYSIGICVPFIKFIFSSIITMKGKQMHTLCRPEFL